ANISTIKGKVKVPITGRKQAKLNDNFLSAQLIYKNNAFYLNVIFEEEKEIPKEENFEHFVGVDLGINNIATVVVQNKRGEVLETKFFSGKQLIEKRRRFSDLRKELSKKKLLNEIKKTKNRERNYMKDINHKISRKIINIAKQSFSYINCSEPISIYFYLTGLTNCFRLRTSHHLTKTVPANLRSICRIDSSH
ncbi:unnamed protein product, partial [marine sediment metagenome]